MILLNFVVGIIAGLLVPWAERQMRDWAESIWLGGMTLTDREFDRAALLVIVMVAAVVCAVLGVWSSAFMLAFGMLVGLFGKRIWARIRHPEVRS